MTTVFVWFFFSAKTICPGSSLTSELYERLCPDLLSSVRSVNKTHLDTFKLCIWGDFFFFFFQSTLLCNFNLSLGGGNTKDLGRMLATDEGCSLSSSAPRQEEGETALDSAFGISIVEQANLSSKFPAISQPVVLNHIVSGSL